MTHDFKTALIHLEQEMNMHNAAELMGTPLEKQFRTLRHALRIADKLMQEPSREMQDIGSGTGRHRMTGWKTPLTGMRVSSTEYDEKDRAVNCFKAMRDQMLKEVAG